MDKELCVRLCREVSTELVKKIIYSVHEEIKNTDWDYCETFSKIVLEAAERVSAAFILSTAEISGISLEKVIKKFNNNLVKRVRNANVRSSLRELLRKLLKQ